MPTLILTPRFTEDAQALWRAASRRGWDVDRLPTWRVPQELLEVADPVFYLEGLFAQTIAGQFGITLAEPSLDWLPTLSELYRKRSLSLTTLNQARSITEPSFIKPPNDKSFPAGIYKGDTLPEGYDGDTPVLVAEIVHWEKEFRCFVLDRTIRTISVYLRNGELQRDVDFTQTAEEVAEASQFLQTLLDDDAVPLPRGAVVDVGVIRDRGWAVVEQNAAWGCGIYGCDPDAVLEVLQVLAEPRP